MHIARFRVLFVVFVLLAGVRSALALGEKSYVTFAATDGALPLVANGTTVPVLVDAGDWPGVARATQDLCDDVARVSGIHPALLHQIDAPRGKEIVIVGTLGRSPLVDDLVKRGKLDVTAVAGKWEAAVTRIVEHPIPGIDRALVIAGSDKRGTIYGVYDLSEQMGVSPWYWWADVRVPHHAAIYVQPGPVLQPEPAVRYRGIFLNDEAPALSGWAHEKFGGFNSSFYGHVFELLLRLRANYLWPAMWGSAFNEDDPKNPLLADEYGIVMGTSHHEPMLRAQQEWKLHGSGPWNYATNAKELQSFWRQGIHRNRNLESSVTLGMRGDGDKPMSTTDDVGLLQQVIHDQLQILQQESTPVLQHDLKVWALYKEVQGYYEKGMRVPDDVTLLWSDDNWGNLRRLPTPEERQRSGGAGIYYHFDYVGGPRSYKWINTYSITKVWEQMHLALEYGADRLWIVNVGDLKPMEFPIEFFLSYARTPQRWSESNLHEFAVLWASREFGPEHAEQIASAVETYTRYNGRRKPEDINAGTFSLGNFGEASRVEEEWETLQKQVDGLASALPENERASFFELVQYPVDASANLTRMYIAQARNEQAVAQGRADANIYAAQVRARFLRDQQLADTYNHRLLNGRWNHMMDQTHIGYTSWNDPKVNILPETRTTAPRETGPLGAAVGNQSGSTLHLGSFDSAAPGSKPLTLFTRGVAASPWQLQADQPWVLMGDKAGKAQGTVHNEVDIPVSIDWSATPPGTAAAVITIGDGTTEIAKVTLQTHRRAPGPDGTRGFVEADGIIAIEAEHTSARRAAGPVHWVTLPGFGRTLSAVTPLPISMQSGMASGAELEYQVYTSDAGRFDLDCVLSPTLNFVPGRGLRFAVSVDDGPRQTVDIFAHATDADWSRSVLDGVRVVSTPLNLGAPGAHTLHIWSIDPGVVLERLVLHSAPLPYSYLGPPESFRAPDPGSSGNSGGRQ